MLKIKPDITFSALEYLLDVRQQHLIEALNKAAQQGNHRMTNDLREEIDKTSLLLQQLRTYEEANFKSKIERSNQIGRKKQ